MSSLDLGLVGNGSICALVNAAAEIVWACFPRFDSDPTFCALLADHAVGEGKGYYAIEIVDLARQEQAYLDNTPILVTRLFDRHGGCVEITDFAPRFRQFGRMFCPMSLIRQVKRVAGTPRMRVRLRPAIQHGRYAAERTYGSNHVRFIGGDVVLRLTTDVSLTAIAEESPFFLEDTATLILGPDETLQGAVSEVGHRFLEETAHYWRGWVRALAVPFEWQDAVIRAAITLKLNAYEDTGAIVAAMTTSIPEAAGSGRNWDYRYCWLRDAYFVVDALNRLGATRTMERFLSYILNIVAGRDDGRLQPLYTISGRTEVDEHIVDTLPGYRGMGPVRIGNDAFRQVQHDVYGSAILAATHVFFDRRLERRGDETLFRRLEPLGHVAALLYDKPDAGIWELRGSAHVHTFSSMMCWAGCDRLAKIAVRIGMPDTATFWRNESSRLHAAICERSWNPRLNSFVATMGGDALDASLLRMIDLGFLPPDDPRIIATVEAVGRGLRRGDFIYRYIGEDDFGRPENAFLACTFWYINALAVLGRVGEARELFEGVLSHRNRHGLLAEHIDPTTHEQWGNFVQTYSMVGVVSNAVRLSLPWEKAF